MEIVTGSIEDCSQADMHAEFANAFIGGGVMTGDFAMEEILFLVKPELLIAMALQNRMADTEAVCVHGALQYSVVSGYGSEFEFVGDCERDAFHGAETGRPHQRSSSEANGRSKQFTAASIPAVCAIDAIR